VCDEDGDDERGVGESDEDGDDERGVGESDEDGDVDSYQSWAQNHYFVPRYRYSLVTIMYWKVRITM
jgi:hypothetical protein